MIFRQSNKQHEIGLVIDWKFHKGNKWVSTFAPHLVQAIIKEFNPVIINSQHKYQWHRKKIKCIISMEPGWAAPKLTYDKLPGQLILMLASDPHNKTAWFQDYVIDNDIDFILSQYYNPFFYHFPDFPTERFVHFPWAVPDQYLSSNEIIHRTDEVVIFGGQHSDAYDIRNWCRKQQGIKSFSFSGCEDKRLSDTEYYIWLTQFDAIVAAGSSLPQYDLVTPKYFEILAAGALLIGQECKDLSLLGINGTNSLLFSRDSFNEVIHNYRKNPEEYIETRKNGLQLLTTNHLISHRIELIKKIIEKNEAN